MRKPRYRFYNSTDRKKLKKVLGSNPKRSEMTIHEAAERDRWWVLSELIEKDPSLINAKFDHSYYGDVASHMVTNTLLGIDLKRFADRLPLPNFVTYFVLHPLIVAGLGPAIEAVENKNGWTPLHFAADLGSVQSAKYLIRHGADFYQTDNQGRTFLDIARARENYDFINICQKAIRKSVDSKKSELSILERLLLSPVYSQFMSFLDPQSLANFSAINKLVSFNRQDFDEFWRDFLSAKGVQSAALGHCRQIFLNYPLARRDEYYHIVSARRRKDDKETIASQLFDYGVLVWKFYGICSSPTVTVLGGAVAILLVGASFFLKRSSSTVLQVAGYGLPAFIEDDIPQGIISLAIQAIGKYGIDYALDILWDLYIYLTDQESPEVSDDNFDGISGKVFAIAETGLTVLNGAVSNKLSKDIVKTLRENDVEWFKWFDEIFECFKEKKPLTDQQKKWLNKNESVKTALEKSSEGPVENSSLVLVDDIPDPVEQNGSYCKLVALANTLRRELQRQGADPETIFVESPENDNLPMQRPSLLEQAYAKGSVVGEVYNSQMLVDLAKDNGFNNVSVVRPAQNSYVSTITRLIDTNVTPMVFFDVGCCDIEDPNFGGPVFTNSQNEHGAVVIGYMKDALNNMKFILAHWGRYFVVSADDLSKSSNQLQTIRTPEVFYKGSKRWYTAREYYDENGAVNKFWEGYEIRMANQIQSIQNSLKGAILVVGENFQFLKSLFSAVTKPLLIWASPKVSESENVDERVIDIHNLSA